MCAEKSIAYQLFYVLQLDTEYFKVLHTFYFYVSVIGMRAKSLLFAMRV